MGLSLVHSRARVGVRAPAVQVEVHVGGGLPSMSIVGLPQAAVREAKDRVRAAIHCAQFDFPNGRITVNLAPADLPKSGGRFDLPIALGVLAASGQLPNEALRECEFLGELGLTGELREVDGALPAAVAAHAAGRRLILPPGNAPEAALAESADVRVARTLLEVCGALTGDKPLPDARRVETHRPDVPDLADVRGQAHARRALEIAAAGQHHVLFVGPPGCGKTLLASRLPGLLPDASEHEALESASVASVSGRGFDAATWRTRPFRAPHHGASAAALVGGGPDPRPGEVSLAHNGVLFLDELPEWGRASLQMLREPLESGVVTVARARHRCEYPARFQLVAAMNPCPCGWAGDPAGRCKCTEEMIQRYVARISGPLMDRIDLHVDVPRLPPSLLRDDAPRGESTAIVRTRVAAARERQLARAGCSNAHLDAARTAATCRPCTRRRAPARTRCGHAAALRAFDAPHPAGRPHHRRPGRGRRHRDHAPHRSDRLPQARSRALRFRDRLPAGAVACRARLQAPSPDPRRLERLHEIDVRLLGWALLILAGIASSLVARRFGAPLLLAFLLLGLLLGEDGPGGIQYSDTRFTHLVGSLALAVILFDGGLRTKAAHVRGAVAPSLVLATVGVVVTAGLTALAATWLLDLPWLESTLLGVIVASTDAAAVFFLLRAGGLHLERRTNATLEMESGSNDPMAIFLTLALTAWIAGTTEGGPWTIAMQLVWAFGAGIVAGYVGGRLMVWTLNKFELTSGLHPWLALSGAVSLFALTNLVGGSGYLAVYLAGIVVANRPVRARNEVMSVQDAATWFAQLVMFLLLGLLATPHKLLVVLWPALGVAAFLMFVARPVAVLACLAPFRYRPAEMGFIAWTGLRGAVGIFLASIPLLADLPNATLYFNVAFVVVFASLVVQGWTLASAAHWFGVAVPRADPNTRRVQLDLPGQLEYDMVGYRIAPGSAVLRGSALPGRSRLAMVVREGRVLLPEEAGDLRADDYAYVLAPVGQAPRLDWWFAEGRDAKAAEQDLFGSFTLPGDVPLGELASFYGLQLPARFSDATAAELFDERFDEQPQIGDRLALGKAVLVVRSLKDDRVAQVGLKFTNVGERLLGGR